MGLCLVSAITQEPTENPIAFLKRLKEALQKFSNLKNSDDREEKKKEPNRPPSISMGGLP